MTFSKTMVQAAVLSAVILSLASPAAADPYTPEQQHYIDSAKAAGVTGTDDTVFNMGVRACNYLNSKIDNSVIIGSIMMSENVTRPQAITVVDLAKEQLCDHIGRRRSW